MNPTREEIAGWLTELADWFESIATMSTFTCTNDLNLKRANTWRERAAQVEQSATDPLLKRMAEVLERVSEDGHALLSMTIGSRNAVLQALQSYRDLEKTDADE